MSIFVDSSAWYAAVDRSDRHNTRAKKLLGSEEPLVTSDHVLVETWRLVHHFPLPWRRGVILGRIAKRRSGNRAND